MESSENILDDLLRAYEVDTLFSPGPEDFDLFAFGADINPATESPPINSASPTIPSTDDVPDLVHEVCDSCAKSLQSTETDILQRIQLIEEG